MWDYFKSPYIYSKSFAYYHVIEIGKPYVEIRHVLEQIRLETQIDFIGYGDMTIDEVVLETGLDLKAAKRVMQRDYSETVKLEISEKEVENFKKALR